MAELNEIDPRDYKVPPLGRNSKDEYLAKYVCSNCWGHLVAFPLKDGNWLVVCPTCGMEMRGYVTKTWANNRRQESYFEAAEVRKNLRGLLPSSTDGKSDKDLLKELGY